MIKRKLLILVLVAVIIFVLLTSGCTCGCVATEWLPAITGDNSGGAIVTYGIYEDGDRNAYVQRIDVEGNKLWGDKGVLLSSASPPNWLRQPHIVADGFGGAIIVWMESESVFAQKVDSEGHTEWRKSNMPVTRYPRVISDGSGGAIIASSSYSEEKEESLLQILRMDSEGNLLWTENDAPISLGLLDERFEMLSDNSGGAIIVWKKRSADIFAQRIDSEGNILWKQGGLEISTARSYNPRVIGDGLGGAIVVWKHVKRDEEGHQINSIYAQRVEAEGNVLWQQGGLPICSSSEFPINNPHIVSDGSGGAIIAWVTPFDIYAQRIDSDGNIQWSKDGVKVQGREGPQGSYRIQGSHHVIADGSGGAIIASGKTNGNARRLRGLCYVQKLDAKGRNQWQPDGTLVSTKNYYPIISDDGFGGAVVLCWPYIQKINAEGERVWGEKGVLLSRKDIF